MARLNIERQNTLQPKRMEFAKQKITELGYTITSETETELRFELNGKIVCFFPYSGWHSGASIKDGRGLSKLLKQINTK